MAKQEAAGEEFKYGVDELAEQLGILGTSVRVALRKHNIKKPGNKYGWNNQAEFKEVVNKLKAAGEKAPGKKAAPAKKK
jgi:hypothetical protein